MVERKGLTVEVHTADDVTLTFTGRMLSSGGTLITFMTKLPSEGGGMPNRYCFAIPGGAGTACGQSR